MARRGSETRQMAAQILVRLPASAAAEVSARAAAAGVTDAALVRQVLVAALGVHAGDARPVPRKRAALPAPSALLQQIAALREALGEATGALTRSAVFARNAADEDTLGLINELAAIYRARTLEIDEIKGALLAIERSSS